MIAQPQKIGFSAAVVVVVVVVVFVVVVVVVFVVASDNDSWSFSDKMSWDVIGLGNSPGEGGGKRKGG